MASPFQGLFQPAEGIIHGQFGEPFLHLPMARRTDVGLDVAPDATRPSGIVFNGVFRSADAPPTEMRTYDPRETRRPGVSAVKLSVLIPSNAGISVKVGDQFERLSDSTFYRVTNTWSPETGAIIADVNVHQ